MREIDFNAVAEYFHDRRHRSADVRGFRSLQERGRAARAPIAIFLLLGGGQRPAEDEASKRRTLPSLAYLPEGGTETDPDASGLSLGAAARASFHHRRGSQESLLDTDPHSDAWHSRDTL